MISNVSCLELAAGDVAVGAAEEFATSRMVPDAAGGGAGGKRWYVSCRTIVATGILELLAM